LEAYYGEKLRDVYLRRDKNRSKSQMSNIETQKVNALMQKNELMSILDDSVEEVKKQIMRRRAK
jgi:translation initiation factor 2B subunit (eIF-2B alpha/beta/delta family)